jgi:hypothetical protein
MLPSPSSGEHDTVRRCGTRQGTGACRRRADVALSTSNASSTAFARWGSREGYSHQACCPIEPKTLMCKDRGN